MTTCPRSEDLYLYLEAGLGPYKARALEEHLEQCAACREALAERRLLHEAFTTLPPFEVPPDFARSVMDGLPEPAEIRGGWLAPLVAATAALIVGLLGFYLLTGASLSDVLVASNRFFATGDGTGFVFDLPTPAAIYDTVGWSLWAWHHRPRHLDAMRKRAMRVRFEWGDAAARYGELYQGAIDRRLGRVPRS